MHVHAIIMHVGRANMDWLDASFGVIAFLITITCVGYHVEEALVHVWTYTSVANNLDCNKIRFAFGFAHWACHSAMAVAGGLSTLGACSEMLAGQAHRAKSAQLYFPKNCGCASQTLAGLQSVFGGI